MTTTNKDMLNARDSVGAHVDRNAVLADTVKPGGRYKVVCTRPAPGFEDRFSELRDLLAMPKNAGNFALRGEFDAIPRIEKWRDAIENTVTTVGKNEMLEEYMEGAAYTTSMFMGLKGVGTAVVADTQASHASWLEVGTANAPAYSGTRPVPSFGAAAAGVKATDADAVFNITSSGTVAGCFINQGGTSAIDNTTGVLFSAGDFTGGNKVVDNLDTLNVSYSLAL